ncbi:hypothetical protein BS78_04G067700 [Paspalum vaginatum]|nr:hypothetical protein BS78_04G067700 [Paspalum vaginatum]
MGSGEKEIRLGRDKNVPVFYLDMNDLCSSYCQLMVDIPKRIIDLVKEEIKQLPHGEKHNELINGKLYTPSGGSFIVEMVGKEMGQTKRVSLLYRWSDLYFDSYYVGGKWYQFLDSEAVIPPKTQMPYCDSDIHTLQTFLTHAGLGGHTITVGSTAFEHCFYSLSKTEQMLLRNEAACLAALLKGPLSLPAFLFRL